MSHPLEYRQLQTHIHQVAQGSASLDAKKFDDFRTLGLYKSLSKQECGVLALSLYRLLPELQDDPTDINELLEALLDGFPLEEILQIEPPVDFVRGLDIRAKPFHSLTLSLLAKGETDIASARRLATTQPAIFSALVKLWLCTESAGTARQALSVVMALLKADRELDGSGILPALADDPMGLATDNPIWRRFFRDADVYHEFYHHTHLTLTEQGLSQKRRTIAQARLMQMLPLLGALDWSAVAGSHLRSVESLFNLDAGQGLLEWAASRMVQLDDLLMHGSLIQFFIRLLETFKTDEYSASHSSSALDYLISSKLHERTILYYTHPAHPSHNHEDVPYLYSTVAEYVCTYARYSPHHFLSASSEPIRSAILARLNTTLNVSPSTWQNRPPSEADLSVLHSVPRTLLVPSPTTQSPLLFLPTWPANAGVFTTLKVVFSGPAESIPDPDATTAAIQEQHFAVPKEARLLYLAYLARNQRMWSDVVRAAETVSMTHVALAAIGLIEGVARARWTCTTAPSSPDESSAVETSTADDSGPQTGIEALLSHPGMATVLPYLVRAPQTFSNLVGGRGDAEAAAYRVATKKFDALVAVHGELVAWMTGGRPRVEGRRAELERVERCLRYRCREGVWGSESGRGRGDLGARIATLEL